MTVAQIAALVETHARVHSAGAGSNGHRQTVPGTVADLVALDRMQP